MAGKQVCHINSMDEDDHLCQGNKSDCHISSLDEDDQL